MKDADINPWSERTNCYEVVFALESKVANTNVWVEFTAYAADNYPLYVGDSISFDACATYTNEIVVAVDGNGKSGTITFVWDAGRCGAAGSVHHAIIDARLPDEDVVVACQNGRFVGLRHSETKVVSFKSVPFAAPAKRWLPPEPPEDSDEIISARRFGPVAAQTFDPSEYASGCPNSEDCLKLTVWTADGFEGKNNRSVMFFIHGGSYVLGGMCDPLYDGSNIVKDNPDVIVVSCDYRLCAFGFLDLSEVPGFSSEYAQAPNLGILDLQAGLRWVRDNIANFGGDPDNVTIFGESAGGGSVSCLLQAKGSEGLFRRAIVMSGTVDLTDSAALYKGSNQTRLLMAAAGAKNLDELRALSTSEFLAALNTPLDDPRLAGISHIAPREGGTIVAEMNNRPMCDDVRGIVPSDPFAAFATNAIAKDVDVMIGSTSEELNYWACLLYDENDAEHPLDRYSEFLSNNVRRTQNIYTQLGYGSEVLEFLRDVATAHPFDANPEYTYSGRYPEIWGRTELRSELAFRMPSIIMAEQHLKQVANFGGAGKTYMYYFCRPMVVPDMPWIGACHASELTSVFRNLHLDVDGTNRVALANRVSGAFVNFAKYGDPNGAKGEEGGVVIEGGVDYWKTYDATNRYTMVIGEIGDFTNSIMRLVADPKKRQRELLEPGYLNYHAKIANGLEAPAGSSENPWELSREGDKIATVAWTNGTTLVVVTGLTMTNIYPLTEGQYIVSQEATLQRPDDKNWNGRVEVNCLVFDPAAGARPFGSNVKLGLTASAPVKRLHRLMFGQLDHEDLMVNLTGAPQFETLVWDAALDSVKEGEVGTVTATASEPALNPDCLVTVSNGTFVGVLDGTTHVRSWKGIPYAQQPTGPRRWKKAGDPAPDAWTYSAKQFGHAPIQTLSLDEPSALDQGEDCLVLNVWSTDAGTDVGCDFGKRPVAVYIHGGGFMQGCTTDDLYDGRPIVERNPDIVVVTINYRVSYLSFIDLTGVPGAEDYPDAHNLGILDQRQALKWVHDNIAAFGGDPEKVTLFGESAGGASVAVHLTSPESAPYFKRVLQMSGALDMTMSENAYRNRNLTPSIRAAVAEMRFGDVSRSNEVDMAMLQTLTADELRNLVIAPIGDPNAPEWESPMGGLCGGDAYVYAAICSPMRDDVRGCVPYKPFEALATNGVANDKDYMVGTTGQESRYFVWQSTEDDPLREFYSGFLYDHLRSDMYWVKSDENRAIISNFLATVETERDEMDARYPGIWKLTALEDQLFMRLPAIKMADIHAGLPSKEGAKGKTFMYRFDKGVELDDKPWAKAGHGCELPYFFGNTSYAFEGQVDEGLATTVSTAFANFVRTGDPNDDGKAKGAVGGTEWTEYDAVSRQTMLFNNDCTVTLVSDPDKSARKQLTPLYDTYDEGHHGEAPSRRTSGIKYELTPLPPAGVASDPWQVGRTTADDVIAYRDLKGKVFIEGTGAMRDLYAVNGGLWFGPETVAAEFGAGVTSIGSNAFSQCSGLKVVVSLSATPPTLGGNALPLAEQLDAILVPSASVEAYRGAWPEYADVIKPCCADTVVYGTIRTAEDGNPVAEAIAIKDGKYVYVGDEAGVAAYIQDGVTKVIDHRSKGMVMPGCTDGHSHYINTIAMGNMKGGILFDAEDDKDAVLQKLSVATQKAKAAGKHSLCGFGWNILALRMEAMLTLAELDEATYGVSTVILDSSGHHAYCNSECLKRCGIIDGNGNVLIKKIDGGVLELDGNEYPTGYVNERVTGYLTRMGGIDADELIDDEVAEDAILKSQELLLSTGYTTMLDGWSNNLHSNKFYEVANRMDLNGALKLVVPMTYEVEPWQTNMTSEIDYLDWLNTTYRTRHVRPEYLKVFMDGVVETTTGAMLKPYKDGTVYKSFWSVDRLADITAACNARGLTVHVHTMGDAAIRETVDAYIRGGNGTQRNCLVHLRNVSTNEFNDFQRIAENNIACTAGMTWHVSDLGFEEYLSGILDEEYVKHAYPIKSFFDAGVKVSSHSDYAANFPSPQDPFGMIQVAVTGMLPNPGETDYPFDTNELITVEQAFQALTLNGAWQMGLENARGSIKVGKWADFVLADQDVFTCAATDIGKTKVVSTWFEGEKVYQTPPLGCKANPWKIGTVDHENEVTAWTNGTETLVIDGAGAVGSMPWAESPAGIARLVKAEGVTGLEELVGSLPDLTSVNGLTLEDFSSAIRGFVKADGFSAIEVKNGEAKLDVVIGRSDSLGESSEWKPVSTNTVEVPAPGEHGFFIVAPLFYVPGSDHILTGSVYEVPGGRRHK